jgi:uncharacterized damage-inducible protein DinB
MTAPWTAPPVERPDELKTGAERSLLQSWLDWHRQTLLTKCAGLTSAQLKTAAVPPSTLTLLGLVRHLTDVERSWFRRRAAGEPVDLIYETDDQPDADFEKVADADAAEAIALFQAELKLADAAVAGLPLDHEFQHRTTRSLRWVYLHLIEEYARHNGHADLLRERLDGATGD